MIWQDDEGLTLYQQSRLEWLDSKERQRVQERCFLRDIIENPADDTPRLIYADWLSDYGSEAEQERGEWIRAQIGLYDAVVRQGLRGGPKYADAMRSARETTTQSVLAWTRQVEAALFSQGARGLASEQTMLDILSVVPGGRKGSYRIGRNPEDWNSYRGDNCLRWRRGFPEGCVVGNYPVPSHSRVYPFAESCKNIADTLDRVKRIMPLAGLLLIPSSQVIPQYERPESMYCFQRLSNSLAGIDELDLSLFDTDSISLTCLLGQYARRLKIPGAPLMRSSRRDDRPSRPAGLEQWSADDIRGLTQSLCSRSLEYISLGRMLEYRFRKSDLMSKEKASRWAELALAGQPVQVMEERWVPLDLV